MKLGFITHWYDPEVGSASLSGTISRALGRRGDDVRVVTGFPIYPAGRLYPGYRMRPYQRETLRGVDVRRSVIYPSHDRSALRRMANYASFAATGSLTAAATLWDRDANLVFCSPATASLPAMVSRASAKVPYVLHVQDLWPDSVLSSGFLPRRAGALARGSINAGLRAVYGAAHHIAVTSPGMADELTLRGVPTGKLSVVPNWADEQAFRPVGRNPALASSLGIVAPHVIMYAGNMGEVQGLDVLIEAAALLRGRVDIQFAFVGDGVSRPKLREQVRELDLDNVTFIDPQPFDRMADILALGSVQVVTLIDDPLFAMTLPSKLQATMCSGHPVLGILAGDGADLVRRAGAGRTARPGDPGSIAAALAEMLDDAPALASMGANGRAFYSEHLSEAAGASALLDLLERAAGAR
ncbi:glycosyltransferase family 4 protein [Arsenicicoccus bolidensis]|uniref:glycosyltransferase family 4 protein n=1 Tax=Arsenicicoccus bolidensis TaxID=229480 RepID=UPI0004923A8C|nr:glycosyltransferase family 4 protein [Arsenicicoccus bolidensis]